jgi:hypothetical protein
VISLRTSSRIIPMVFAVVCVAPLRLKLEEAPISAGGFRVGAWVPAVGCVLCAGLLAADLVWG